MNNRIELAEKLSSIIDDIVKNCSENISEFSDDETTLLINSIQSFVTTLIQQSNNAKLLSADIIHGLSLQCHPEGGFYRRISWTEHQTKIFYLLPTGCVSSWHRLNGIRETWTWLCGGTLIVSQISNDSRWVGVNEMGHDNDVTVVEECNGNWGNWFGAYPKDGDFTLVTCECTPAFEFSKFQLANEEDVNQFRKLNPEHGEIIALLADNLSG